MATKAVAIIQEDESLLAVDKPPGIETIAIGKHEGDERYCLTTRCRKATGLATLAPAHRLDRDTTGVQIFAKTAAALQRLEALFRQRRVAKEYLAICLGIPANAEGVIRRNLSDWQGGRRPVQVVKSKGGFKAESHYRRLSQGSLTAPASSDRRTAKSLSLIHI
ncbi:MAG: pseudouridine synthase, partial [Planctomycetota bacterium]|nr:pseudouridine synthase [Planctomycetota bacterium]